MAGKKLQWNELPSCQRAFDDVLARLDKGIGRTNFGELGCRTNGAATLEEYESVVQECCRECGAEGVYAGWTWGGVAKISHRSGLQDYSNYYWESAALRRMRGPMPPATILIFERKDGLHVSYDMMASYLADCGSEKALQVARDLDERILRLLEEATGQA